MADIQTPLLTLADEIKATDKELSVAVRLYAYEPSTKNAEYMMAIAAEDGEYYDQLDSLIGYNL